jgi:beta-barrel assembly-enhancing protease
VAKAYEEFEARAFHPDRGNEPIEGVIYLTAGAFVFRGEGAEIQIPLPRLTARFDDAGEGRIILHDSVQPDWTVTTTDRRVLEFPEVPSLAELAEQIESQATRGELSRRMKIVVLFFVGAGLVLWLGMIATGTMVRAIVAKIPPEKEREFGSALLDEFKGELTFLDDTNQVAELTAMAQPLLRALPATQQWQFYLINEPSPNAFALPGGHIVVTTGLLRLVERPEELLGVVSHEVAHVTCKHGFRQAIASAGPFLVFQVFLSGQGGALGAVAGGSAILVSQSFSQEYEKEADDVGWDYLVKANIDPRGMIEMFRKLKDVEASESTSELIPKAFNSHPDMDKRIARLNGKWKKLFRKTGFVQLEQDLTRPQ